LLENSTDAGSRIAGFSAKTGKSVPAIVNDMQELWKWARRATATIDRFRAQASELLSDTGTILQLSMKSKENIKQLIDFAGNLPARIEAVEKAPEIRSIIIDAEVFRSRCKFIVEREKTSARSSPR